MKMPNMEVARRISVAGLALVAACALAQEPRAGDKGKGLNAESDKRAGYVSVQSDLVLHDDRLIITVGAFNKGGKPEPFSPAAVSVTTAAGKPVPLVSLAQLEDETRAAFGGPPAKSPGEYAKMPTAQRSFDVSSATDTDSGAYTGGEGLGSAVPEVKKKKKKVDEAKLNAALENLRAGILKEMSVEPRAAAGGQVVTQSFKFGRGEPRKLKMAVDFAGEQHEFEFDVPDQVSK